MFQVTAILRKGGIIKFTVKQLQTKRNQLQLIGDSHRIVINHTGKFSQVLLYECNGINRTNLGCVKIA